MSIWDSSFACWQAVPFMDYSDSHDLQGFIFTKLIDLLPDGGRCLSCINPSFWHDRHTRSGYMTHLMTSPADLSSISVPSLAMTCLGCRISEAAGVFQLLVWPSLRAALFHPGYLSQHAGNTFYIISPRTLLSYAVSYKKSSNFMA